MGMLCSCDLPMGIIIITLQCGECKPSGGKEGSYIVAVSDSCLRLTKNIYLWLVCYEL